MISCADRTNLVVGPYVNRRKVLARRLRLTVHDAVPYRGLSVSAPDSGAVNGADGPTIGYQAWGC